MSEPKKYANSTVKTSSLGSACIAAQRPYTSAEVVHHIIVKVVTMEKESIKIVMVWKTVHLEFHIHLLVLM